MSLSGGVKKFVNLLVPVLLQTLSVITFHLGHLYIWLGVLGYKFISSSFVKRWAMIGAGKMTFKATTTVVVFYALVS